MGRLDGLKALRWWLFSKREIIRLHRLHIRLAQLQMEKIGRLEDELDRLRIGTLETHEPVDPHA